MNVNAFDYDSGGLVNMRILICSILTTFCGCLAALGGLLMASPVRATPADARAQAASRAGALVAPTFRGLGATGVISVYEDRSKALLVYGPPYGKQTLSIWTPRGGAKRRMSLDDLQYVESVSADGRTLILPKVDHVNGPGPGEGRFYGHYTTWSEAAGSRIIAPRDVVSYQMGVVWSFQLSHDGNRVLVHGPPTDAVFASDGAAGAFQPLKVAGAAVAFESGKPGAFSAHIIALSPDGTVVVTEDGARYRISGRIERLAEDMKAFLSRVSDEDPQIVVSRYAASAVGTHFQGPQFFGGPEDYPVYEKKVTIRLLRWDGRGIRDLGWVGFLPDKDNLRISEDGSVLVGIYGFDPTFRRKPPAVWTEATGIRPISDVLRSLGLGPAMRGWKLRSVVWVSADGAVLAGEGVNPRGKAEAWVVVLPKGWPKRASHRQKIK